MDYGCRLKVQGKAALEQQAALMLGRLMRNGMSISPCDVHAQLEQDRAGYHTLTVTLDDALPHDARLPRQKDHTARHLQMAYSVLYQIYYGMYRGQMEALVSRIIGESVEESTMGVNAGSGDISVRFVLRPA